MAGYDSQDDIENNYASVSKQPRLGKTTKGNKTNKKNNHPPPDCAEACGGFLVLIFILGLPILFIYKIYFATLFEFQVESFDVSSMNLAHNNNNNYSADIDLTLSVKRTRWFSQNKLFESLDMGVRYRHWNVSSLKLESFKQEDGRKINLRVGVRDVELENVTSNLLATDLVSGRALPFALTIRGEYWDIDSTGDRGYAMKIVCNDIMVKFSNPSNGTSINTPLTCTTKTPAEEPRATVVHGRAIVVPNYNYDSDLD